ncbi:hypothetical protein J6590_038541 [Homalodisca vitripennis]|nr:hypothetical protein J6590_038541 [Homalodisca vitripennis]
MMHGSGEDRPSVTGRHSDTATRQHGYTGCGCTELHRVHDLLKGGILNASGFQEILQEFPEVPRDRNFLKAGSS